MPLSNDRNKSFLDEWLVPGLQQKYPKLRLQHILGPERKEVLKKKKKDEVNLRGTEAQTEHAPNSQNWKNLSKKIIT